MVYLRGVGLVASSLLILLLCASSAGAQVINTFPYSQDFETLANGTGSGTTAYVFTNGWTAITSPVYWQADAGGTSSSGTGPAVDHNPGTALGKYIYLETSQGALGNEARVMSPRFDHSALGAPAVELWYHMLGATMGQMHFDLIEYFNSNTNGSNTGTTFTSATATFVAAHVGSSIEIIGGGNAGTYTIAAVVNATTVTLTAAPPSNLTGMSYDHFELTLDAVPAWTDNLDLWQTKAISLLALFTGGGSIEHFAFIMRGTRGSSFTGDMAFDDVTVFDGANDVGVSAVVNPVSGSGLGPAESVTVTVQNFGSNPQSNIPVTMIFNGGTPVMESMPGPLAPNSSAPFTFTATVNMSAQGAYTLQVSTSLATDQLASNDGISVVVFKPITAPYSTDFESGPDGWTTYGTTTFARGTPAKPVINSAFSGTNAWVTGLAASYLNGETGGVQSPAFDFSGYTQDPWVFIRVWWNSEFSWDGAVLQTSINSGQSWQTVGAFGDPNNWYTDTTIDGNPGGQQHGWTGRASTTNGSGGWVLASHEVTGISGQGAVLFRIAFGSDTSVVDDGFAFDDIFIGSLAEIDVVRNSASIANAGIDNVGNVPTTGGQLTWEIHNVGDLPLDLTGTPVVTIAPGLGTPGLNLVAQPVGPVAGSNFVSFSVDITPAIGPFEFLVTIPSSDGDEDPYTFTVAGTGFDPNAPAQADLAAGSTLSGGTNGPFTLALNPGDALGSAGIELSDAESDNITVTSIVAPGTAPVGIVAPTTPAPGHPIQLSWSGTADASNVPGNYTWTITFQDAANGTPVIVDVTITINDVVPTHVAVVGISGDGSAGAPYLTTYTEGLGGTVAINLADVNDANQGQVLAVSGVNDVSATGGVGFQFMLSANVLVVSPAGTLVANDVGTQIWEVTITDGSNPVLITVTISVNAAIAFTSSPTLTAAQLNGTYPGSTITWTGGTGTVGLAVTSGALPANLSLNATGVVSGTTTDAVGTYNFTVTATDSLGASTALGFSIDVIDPPAGLPVITNGSVLPAGTLNTPYSLNLTVTGGTTPYTFSLDSGTLPSGLSLSAGGVISGTPGAVGPSTFTVRVVDSSSRGVFNSSSFTLSIIAPKKEEESSCTVGIGAGAPALLAVLGLAGLFRRRKNS